ncbi:MAG: alpha-L-fucosidase [Fibrobacterales bacterium]
MLLTRLFMMFLGKMGYGTVSVLLFSIVITLGCSKNIDTMSTVDEGTGLVSNQVESSDHSVVLNGVSSSVDSVPTLSSQVPHLSQGFDGSMPSSSSSVSSGSSNDSPSISSVESMSSNGLSSMREAGLSSDTPMSVVQGPAITEMIISLWGNEAELHDELSIQGGGTIQWAGPSTAVWQLELLEPTEFAIELMYYVPPTGHDHTVEMYSDLNPTRVPLVLKSTSGPHKHIRHNYERHALSATITLSAGAHRLHISSPYAVQYQHLMDLRGVDLIPVEKADAVAAERARAQEARPNTDWMKEAGYGLMFHWTNESIYPDGTIKPFDQMVDQFDMDTYVTMVKKTGAHFVLFTFGHAYAYSPAPIQAWAKHHGADKITERDLVMEMADALAAIDVKLLLYFPTHVISTGWHDPGTGWERNIRLTAEEYVDIQVEILEEIGERYGEKVWAYWFDGWYQSVEWYDGLDIEKFYWASKAGNPNRALCLNSWVFPAISEWQDYWAGEVFNEPDVLQGQFPNYSAAKGLQSQQLVVLDPMWVRQNTDQSVLYSGESLANLIIATMAQGGVITVNVGIYGDGSISAPALSVLEGVKARLVD